VWELRAVNFTSLDLPHDDQEGVWELRAVNFTSLDLPHTF
jgi:hypothetical protein